MTSMKIDEFLRLPTPFYHPDLEHPISNKFPLPLQIITII